MSDARAYDFCVVGGGIVGIATAMKLLEKRPGSSVIVLEKESRLGRHQTGHNSGVIHSGIYYTPGSLKAELCRRGAEATKEFCRENGLLYDICGKLLVATNAAEAVRMEALFERSKSNGLQVERLDAAELAEWEPEVRGVSALYVESTGIVDFNRITEVMGQTIESRGGEIRLGTTVTGIAESASAVTVRTDAGGLTARRLVVCGGLQADRLARMAGLETGFQILPFRGEYFRLPTERKEIIRHLIYPIPDPDLPFLGIHLTRTIDGGVTVGPNAVLSFARERYRKGSVQMRDVREYALFPGLWKVATSNARTAAREMRNSLWKRGYLKECQKYCPSLTLDDLLPMEAGIRAQAVLRDGTLVHDFLFAETDRMLHVCNAPSPAATSAIPIAARIAEKVVS